jgi:hypothetical protein
MGIRTPDLLHAMRIRYVGLGRMESDGEPPACVDSPGTSLGVGESLNTEAPVPGSRGLLERASLTRPDHLAKRWVSLAGVMAAQASFWLAAGGDEPCFVGGCPREAGILCRR